jgi:hypothetical protein
MLSHCANPQCSKPFLRLREGRLFLVETSVMAERADLKKRAGAPQRKTPKRVEYFWLCDQCAPRWTLVQDGGRDIALIPLSQPNDCGQGANAEMREGA